MVILLILWWFYPPINRHRSTWMYACALKCLTIIIVRPAINNFTKRPRSGCKIQSCTFWWLIFPLRCLYKTNTECSAFMQWREYFHSLNSALPHWNGTFHISTQEIFSPLNSNTIYIYIFNSDLTDKGELSHIMAFPVQYNSESGRDCPYSVQNSGIYSLR